MKRIVYLDMDGVIVNFPENLVDVDDSIQRPCKKWCNQTGNHHSDFPGLFETLLPKKEAVAGVYKLQKKFDVFLLSSAPWNNLSSWTHKREWVGKYLPKLERKRLILSHRKDLNRGDYLVDDRHHNGAAGFGNFPNQMWIHFGSQEFPDWETVLEFLMKN